MASPLILVTNPGSASRKYGVYQAGSERAAIHFELENNVVIARIRTNGTFRDCQVSIENIEDSPTEVQRLLVEHNVIREQDTITAVGLRVVAPSSYFLTDRIADDESLEKLRELQHIAPLHISATLSEYHRIHESYPYADMVFVSDSGFHANKPDYAWNYGIRLDDADAYDIKRFGYHGLSVESVVEQLKKAGRLASRMIVCHLGSGASVTAVYNGRSIDTSMGYSPLEGVIMGTRSGTIDYEAAVALKKYAGFTEEELETYLYRRSGLLGLGGSADIRELLRRDESHDHQATLALNTFVHSIHKQIGAMTTAMNGIDAIVFTGTAGERSSILRKKIVAHLQYLDIQLDQDKNYKAKQPSSLTNIAQSAHSKPVFVLSSNEAQAIAEHVAKRLD